MSTVVVAGAGGFVGRRLVDALVARGDTVRRGTRDPAGRPGWVRLDVNADDGLDAALAGADALVYLVHQMGEGAADLHRRELEAAGRVADAAARNGLRRVVYLGAVRPRGEPSPHLRSRLDTGERLRAGAVPTIELRAAMIVGAGSESFTLVRDLALRLPVMILPRWLATRSAPVGIDDVVAALLAAIDDPLAGSAAFDLPGPEILSAQAILQRVAASRGMSPWMISVPVLTPRLSALWVSLVTRAEPSIARQLVDGLTSDLLPDGPIWWDRMPGHVLQPLDEAVRGAVDADVVGSLRARFLERAARRLARKVG